MCHKLNSREGEEVGAGYKDMGLEEGESPEGAYLKRRMKDKIWGNWGDWGGAFRGSRRLMSEALSQRECGV